MNRRTTSGIVVGAAAVVIATVGIVAATTTGGATPAGQAAPTPTPTVTSDAAGVPAPSVIDDLVVDPAVVDPDFGDAVVGVGSQGTPATFSDGLSVSLVTVSDTTTTGQGVGSVSGPAVSVRISITNTGSAEAGLDAVTVNGYTGTERTPLVPADVEGAAPFSGVLAAGATTTADYGFAVDGGDGAIVVTVGTAAGSGLVVLEHR